MPISDRDREFMEQVAAYFRSTKSPRDPNGSIRDTAIKFDINRNKVRKILITMGEIESPFTDEALELRQQGMSIKEIAKILGVSVATVSISLPYEDKVDNTLEPTEHASSVRRYRAYEKEQLRRQAGRSRNKPDLPAARKEDGMAEKKTEGKEWQKDIRMSYTEAYHRPHRFTWEDMDKMRESLKADLAEDSPEVLRSLLAAMDADIAHEENEEEGHFPGALKDRNRSALEQIACDRLPPEPVDVLRLHLELYDEYAEGRIDEEETDIFRRYGRLEHGYSISRDVIVPADIPLYALHYMIQRAFGWQNSHLRKFELPEERFKAITNQNASMWSCLVGVLFRSPYMEDADEFWADDYNGGSFKNWLRKKYTGPYMSQCHGEGLISCQEDMMMLDMDEEYYVMYARAYNRESRQYDGEEYVAEISPMYDHKGKKCPKPKPWFSDTAPYRVEVMKFEDLPSEGLRFVFERNHCSLLERLPIDRVLAAGKFRLPKDCSEEERKYVDEQIENSGTDFYRRYEESIENIIDEQIDSPLMQIQPIPVTDEILYSYDFGDDWKIRITASENCADLVEAGRITQAELDRANVKCREVYRPVLIARDGEMLIDDVGGIHGFAEFLQMVNPELSGLDPEEKEEARQEKKRYLEWAKSLGWHREKTTDFNLL